MKAAEPVHQTRTQPVSLASPRSDDPLPSGSLEPGGSDALHLKEQVRRGNLEGLREYLSRSRRECDWQDRLFMLDLIVPGIPPRALDFACEEEPEAADLLLLRCAHFSDLAITMRGVGSEEQVTEERFSEASRCIQHALKALDKAVQQDSQDPTGHACVLRPLAMFRELTPRLNHEFSQVVALAPDLVPAHRSVVTAFSETWQGNLQLSLEAARSAMAKAGPGSDMAVCLFWAHLLAYSRLAASDQNAKAAEEYLNRPDVIQELDAAFDQWTHPAYTPRRSSIPYLHHAACWYYLAGDRTRLQRALTLASDVFCETPWSMIGDARRVYARARQVAAGKTPARPQKKSDPYEKFFAVIGHGANAIQDGKFEIAEQSLRVALMLARTTLRKFSGDLVPLVLFNQSLLRLKQRRNEESQRIREQATALLDASSPQIASARFQRMMAQVLSKLSEYRRALPFWEQAIRMAGDETDPTGMAGMLQKMGECYCHIGQWDQATIPLRAALKIYEADPGDPRLPGVLLTLGNALHKNSPLDAEACYKKAAELHVARLQFQSATPAWANLGILCSEQGRYAESLEHYERVLSVRQKSPGTPSARIALVLNNIANCYRRMGKFDEAHASVDRAIVLLSPGDAALASAYGTRGMIFLDAGQDEQAVEWLRKASTERRKQPSPNLDTTAENLESEIAALKRLGRNDELTVAQAMLTEVRAAIRAIPRVEHDLSAVKVQSEGAVLVELPFGSRPVRPDGRKNTTLLARRLSEEVQAREVGYSGGWVAIPENTALFFYGPDAEALYKVLEPLLMVESLCSGARVVIRQGSRHREVVLPSQPKASS